jgi:hypothetical protein
MLTWSGAVLTASIAMFGLSGAAVAGPFEDGLAAAQRGDYDTAAKAYRQAADQGNDGAQFILGVMYANGQGVPRDQAEAVRWYVKAAQQGDAGAQYSLAVAYRDGKGVAQDAAQADLWFRKAAAQGDARAIASLGAPSSPPLLQPVSFGPVVRGGQGVPEYNFRAQMNAVFGIGKWRETGGYRSQAREDELRAQGALTVPAGHISRHSLGTPGAPEAYDIVVEGMSPYEAAVFLQRSGARFARLFPESSHGDQGAHLHVEPVMVDQRELEPIAAR